MNFKEMCRTCLRTGEMMSSIFDEEIEPAKHTAAELLAMFTFVQVDKEDDFPHNICDICLKEIQQAYLFHLKCKKSEIILHQLREIRVNLKKLKEIPKQNEIVSDVAGEIESILKEDLKLEDVMNLCDRNIGVSESSAIGRIRPVEEENSNASDKLNLQILEEKCARDLQLAFKRDPDYSNHFMADDANEKKLERIQIVSNFQIKEEGYDPRITLKQEPDHNIPIIRNNAAQNASELNENSSNFEILDECASDYQLIFNAEHDQKNLFIKDNEIDENFEFNEISSNLKVVEEECVPDFHVPFKSERELDIGIDCLKCSACLKQFQSLDMFRGHIVSDHLEENICKLCNEEFECSQLEHSAKHLPFSEPENPSGSTKESITQTEKLHMTVIHKGKSDFQCKICSKVFVHRCRLINHMRTHTGGKPFDNELSPEKSETSNTLLYYTQHTDESISPDKPVPDFQCSVCYKVFSLKSLLRYHMLTHTGEKPFQCKLCPAKFGNRRALLSHRRTKHTDEFISDDKPVPDFQCSICYKVFGVKCKLKNHMRVHTGEKPFHCELCPEKFRNSSALLYHKRTKHTEVFVSANRSVPDFQCSICHKAFGRKSGLKYHMRVHTGEKPFNCELCPEKFGSRRALISHRRNKHTDKLISDDKSVPDLQCSICHKIFGRKSGLKYHLRVHTGEHPFHCELCPEKFENRRTLVSHRRNKHTDKFISDDKPVPDFQCSVCYKVFDLKSRLKNHLYVHAGENPFKCTLCPEKFQRSDALTIHVQTNHTDQVTEDYKCKVCSKVFAFKYSLINHMRIHTKFSSETDQVCSLLNLPNN